MVTAMLLVLFSLVGFVYTTSYQPPVIIDGRPRGGFVGIPYVEHLELLNDAKEQWFTQTLDHFDDSDTRTWKQRYFVNASSFSNAEGTSPVFLMVGGEGELSPAWVAVGAMVEYAQINGALMLALEHRFYGKSHPLEDTTTNSLKYLSSEQALADLATFRQSMVHKFKLSEKNKWIIFGGSYPGALSAWFRYKYPHLAHGAVASSAPMQAQLDFPQYLEVSTASLGTLQCKTNVRLATKAVEELLKSHTGLQYLSHKFKTCNILTNNVYDIMQFTSTIAGNFFGVIQYNKDNRAWEGAKGTNITVDVLCGIMNNEKIGNVIDRYAAVNDMIMKVYSTRCVEVSYDDFIKFMKETDWSSTNAEGSRQWVYQTCTEFGYYQTTDSPKQVYGTSIPLSFYLKQCTDIYGSTFNASNNMKGIHWTNTNYGGYALARSASRIIFPNGSIDPWHALSFLKSEEDIIAVFIQGTAHCANMYPASTDDLQQLTDARKAIGVIIQKWLQ